VACGRSVLDFGAGSGLVAIAAAKAGAAAVRAAEIDPVAAAAIALNAALNGVAVEIVTADIVGRNPGVGLVAAGDVCYERPMAGRIVPWLRGLAAAGALVLLGDPGRAYLPQAGLVARARYAVATSREIEDSEVKETTVWQLLPGPDAGLAAGGKCAT
jgi:predicted nicotinamide N-methyase